MNLESALETPRTSVSIIAPDDMGLTHANLAEALSEPGFSYLDAKAFCRNAHISGVVKHYARSRDPKAAFLYRPDAALALGILKRASDAGFAHPAARLAIGEATQNWRNEDLPHGLPRASLPRSPGTWLLAMYANGQRNFSLDLGFFQMPGKAVPVIGARFRQSHGDLTQGTNFPTETEELEMRSSWTCFLDPVMAHLSRPKTVRH